jgi:hypothetical protein
MEGEPAAVVLPEQAHRQPISTRPSLVDHILDADAWPDAFVDAINDRPHGPDRDITF